MSSWKWFDVIAKQIATVWGACARITIWNILQLAATAKGQPVQDTFLIEDEDEVHVENDEL